jgi:formate dehydrogenase major subunit
LGIAGQGWPSPAPYAGYRAPWGATLDVEENYLIKKLFTALGIIQVENQARI